MDVVLSGSISRGQHMPESPCPNPSPEDNPRVYAPGGSIAPGPMHTRVYERLRESFGAPQRRVHGRSVNWSLRGGPSSASVNLVLSSDEEFPVVWVFDPHDPARGVTATAVLDEDTLETVITDIRQRVFRGGRAPPG